MLPRSNSATTERNLLLLILAAAAATGIDGQARKETVQDILTSGRTPSENEQCGLWLGPSPLKEAQQFGWGHSIFTGKLIKKGTVVLSSGVLDETKQEKVFGDLMVPVYDWEHLDMASLAEWDPDFLNGETTRGESFQAYTGEELTLDVEPPIFHQLWNGEIYHEQVLESQESMRVFMPGLASICPCTWKNFNLAQVKTVTYRDWRNIEGIAHDESPPSPQAGSFSYLSNAFFVAARDILPGEELIVECADNSDEFDPTQFPVSDFKPSEYGGYSICLDDKAEERLADHTPNAAGGSHGGQRGLFAKKNLRRGTTITSSPMIPVHKEEMTMDRKKYAEMVADPETHENLQKARPPKKKQLLLNYMFGHPESSLLWLPTAPHLHSVNHVPNDPMKHTGPNAKLRWHTDLYTEALAAGKPLSRRQTFHHAELLKMDALQVVKKHGMGLMVDLVALRDIGENEEIVIDYGQAWDDAWNEHKKTWTDTVEAIKKGHSREKADRKRRNKIELESRERARAMDGPELLHKHRQKHVENSMTAIPLSSYVTASDYNYLHELDDLKTVTEQMRDPYPSNIQTACYFEVDWLDEELNEDENADLITYQSWYEQSGHFDGCLLPCVVTERREYVPGEILKGSVDGKQRGEYQDDDDYATTIRKEKSNMENGGSQTSKRYTAKLLDSYEENSSVSFDCHIYKRFEYYYMDIPREGIVFVDKVHSTDSWIDQSFRQPIGLPDDMVPSEWRDLSRRKGMRGGQRKKEEELADPEKGMTKEEKAEERQYQQSIKKWTEAESRRDLLEEIGFKMFDNSPRMDL